MKNIFLTLSLVGLALSGCNSTVHKKFSIDDPAATSLSLDVRQRVILNTYKGGDKKNKHVVCAEPSPDAMVIQAASGALDATGGGYGLKAGASSAEAGAYIGQRTQTIQLLRDGFYRACEAYMNGAIGESDYNGIVGGYDEFVVTVLAIDGLTETKAVPPVTINSTSNFNATGGQAGGATPPSGSTNTNVAPGTASDGSSGKVDKDVALIVQKIVEKYLDRAGERAKLRTQPKK